MDEKLFIFTYMGSFLFLIFDQQGDKFINAKRKIWVKQKEKCWKLLFTLNNFSLIFNWYYVIGLPKTVGYSKSYRGELGFCYFKVQLVLVGSLFISIYICNAVWYMEENADDY